MHRTYEQSAGDGATKRGGVEVRLASSRDMEGSALQCHETFTN